MRCSLRNVAVVDFRLTLVAMSSTTAPTDPDLIQRIEETLDSVRPYLMADGGSVRLRSVTDEFVVELELLGACGTCPMSMMTLRAGIEQAIRRAAPEITRVEAVAPAVA